MCNHAVVWPNINTEMSRVVRGWNVTGVRVYVMSIFPTFIVICLKISLRGLLGSGLLKLT